MPLPSKAHLLSTTPRLDEQYKTSFSGADCMVLAYKPHVQLKNADGTLVVEEAKFIEFGNLQTLSISTTRDVAAVRPLGTAWVEEYSSGARTVAGSLVFTMFSGDSLRELEGIRPGRSREDAGSYMADDLPAFNIVINQSNEFGQSVSSVLLGIRIVNSGMTVGVQDIYTEQVYSYVASRWVPFVGVADFTKGLQEILNSNPALEQAITDYYAREAWPEVRLEMVDQLSRDFERMRFQR